MQLFNIGGTDLTKYITVPSYAVNEQDVYKEWEDANGIIHRHVYRKKISGNFTMLFFDKDEYFAFLDLLNSNKGAGGYTPASVYVNNTNKTALIDAFITINPSNTIPYMGTSKNEGFEVTIVER